jgi:hypothetical protein
MSISTLTDLAGSFESLIRHQYLLGYLRDWATVAEEHELILVSPVAIVAAKKAKKRNYPTIEHAHTHAVTLFRSRLIKRDQLLTLIEMSVHESGQKYIRALVDRWAEYLARKTADLELTEIGLEGRSANSVFWEAVEALRGIDGEPLSIGFRLLEKAFGLLKGLIEFGKANKVITRIAVLLSQSRDIVRLYCLISQNELAFGLFGKLCTEREMFLWVNFESVLITMIMEKQDVTARFFEVRENVKLE